jgi:hypothetical protein
MAEESGSTAESSTERGPAARRKRPPTWGVLVFLGLLGGLLIVNHLVTYAGPQVEWIDNDVERAFALAAERGQLVYLYLYDPGDPAHERNERKMFAQIWTRDPLSEAVPCRVDVSRHRGVGLRYGYRRKPLHMVLTAEGRELGRIDGTAVDRLEFRTHITGYITRAEQSDE